MASLAGLTTSLPRTTLKSTWKSLKVNMFTVNYYHHSYFVLLCVNYHHSCDLSADVDLNDGYAVIEVHVFLALS